MMAIVITCVVYAAVLSALSFSNDRLLERKRPVLVVLTLSIVIPVLLICRAEWALARPNPYHRDVGVIESFICVFGVMLSLPIGLLSGFATVAISRRLNSSGKQDVP
jgi:hypothetical protein